MPIVAALTSVAASGTLVSVLSKDCGGRGPVRLWMRNGGAAALTAAQVKLAPPGLAAQAAPIDIAAFATLAAGAAATLVIPAPVDLLTVLVTCAAGTTLDLTVTMP